MGSQLKSINTFVDSVKNKLNKKTDNKTITHNKSCMASTTLIEVCIFVGKFIDFFFLYSGKKNFFPYSNTVELFTPKWGSRNGRAHKYVRVRGTENAS